MPGKPLLVFPSATIAERVKKRRGGANKSYHFPDFSIQKDRLTPQFQSMQQSFITESTEGLNPEKVLVIETYGQIEKFQSAVRGIPGLEWLAEIDEESLEADDSFYKKCKIGKYFFLKNIEAIDKTQSLKLWEILKENDFIDTDGYLTNRNINEFEQFILTEFHEFIEEILKSIKDEDSKIREKPLSGRFFICMSRKQAIDRLVSLWNQWDSEDKKLPYGCGAWVDIFKQTKTIRPWGIQDRLRENGIIEYWIEEVKTKQGTSSKIIFEIELWYSNEEDKRNRIKNEIIDLVLHSTNSFPIN